jgi:hypothetical protein
MPQVQNHDGKNLGDINPLNGLMDSCWALFDALPVAQWRATPMRRLTSKLDADQ